MNSRFRSETAADHARAPHRRHPAAPDGPVGGRAQTSPTTTAPVRPRRIRRPATHRPLPALPAQRVADLDDRVRSLGHSAQPEPPSLLAPPADQPTVPASPGAAAPARPSVIGTAPSTDPLLPAPPTDEEKYWYLGGQKRWYPLAGAAAFVGIGISMTKFALSQPTLWPFLALLTFTVLCAIPGLISSTRRRRLDRGSHEERVRSWSPQRLPSVDVFLPSAGEDVEMLANTFSHVAGLRWDGQLTAYVLDDSARAEVAELAAAHGFVYRTRPDRGRLKKAGNLAYGYAQSSGDFIVVFDADFVPRPDFLHELLPYFDEPDVGIVQSPQFFDTKKEQNWLQRAAGATQELFYRWVQPARDGSNGAICVGTNAVYRRAGLAAASPRSGTVRTCTPASTCSRPVSECATCRSSSPRGCARTSSAASSTSSTGGAPGR